MTSEAANDETIQVLDAIGDVHIALIDATSRMSFAPRGRQQTPRHRTLRGF